MIDFLDPRGPGLVVRAAAALLFGIVILFAPQHALALFVPLFATFVLVEGGAALAGSDPRWWSMSLIGAVGLAACLYCFFIPGEGPVALVTAFGAWSLAVGALEILASAHLRKVTRDEYFLTLSGLTALAIGVSAVAAPIEASRALVPWVGASLVVCGLFRFVVAMRVARATVDESREAYA
jgi:uncharacterized membrane protein HdeD (DUF308 family)